jgi:hypothetical protein
MLESQRAASFASTRRFHSTAWQLQAGLTGAAWRKRRRSFSLDKREFPGRRASGYSLDAIGTIRTGNRAARAGRSPSSVPGYPEVVLVDAARVSECGDAEALRSSAIPRRSNRPDRYDAQLFFPEVNAEW